MRSREHRNRINLVGKRNSNHRRQKKSVEEDGTAIRVRDLFGCVLCDVHVGRGPGVGGSGGGGGGELSAWIAVGAADLRRVPAGRGWRVDVPQEEGRHVHRPRRADRHSERRRRRQNRRRRERAAQDGTIDERKRAGPDAAAQSGGPRLGAEQHARGEAGRLHQRTENPDQPAAGVAQRSRPRARGR